MNIAREFADKHSSVFVFTLLLLLSAVCYHKTLTNSFVQDDIPAIVGNPAARTPVDLRGIFTKNAWGDLPGFTHIPNYRPLTTLTYALTEAAAGQEPFAFHLVNLILHALAAFILFIFAFELFDLKTPALAASILFTVHPLASEAVCGAVNREELLCAVFYLAGLCFFLRGGGRDRADLREGLTPVKPASLPYRSFAIIGFFILALLSKENAVTFPAAILITEIYMNRCNNSRILKSLAKNAALYLSLFLILTGYLLLRLAVLGSFSPNFIPPQDNPLAGAGTTLIERILTPFAIFREMIAMFMSPANLTVDYGVNVFPAVKDFTDGRLAAGFALFALYSAGLLFFWRHKSPLFLALALIIIPFSIFTNTFVLSSIIFAERILYLPLAFFAVFIAGFVYLVRQTVVSEALKMITGLFLVTICIVFALMTIQRSYEWRDEFTLYTSSLAARPDSARLNANIGKLLMDRGDFKKAEAFLTRSLEIDPECAEAYNNLSIIAMREGEFESAHAHLKRALEINPQNGKAWNNLCGLYISRGKFKEACGACKRALSLGVRTMHYDALLLDGLCD